ncbi:MAG: ABC transporter permease [Cyclobacteriaceae bacterium]
MAYLIVKVDSNTMLKNYFKTTIRTFAKNPLSSFINTIGLAAGIACCMVVYAYLSIEFGMESQHSKADRTFMVTSQVDRDGEVENYGVSPAPIGLSMTEDFPQIEEMCRFEDRNAIVKYGDKVFVEWARMVDPSFFKMFDFPTLKGNKNDLTDRNKIVIDQTMAIKYFGEEDPIGQVIEARFGSGPKLPLTIAAVVKADETKTSFNFNFLINYELLELADPVSKSSDWSENISGTFVLLNNPDKQRTLAESMSKYTGIINSAQKDWNVKSFTLEPVATLYNRSVDIRWDISQQADQEGRIILPIIAILMLVLACLNYLNIAISSAVKRLKEIGVRKVIGANRGRLVLQFMIENILQTGIALVVGFIVGTTLFLPGLNNLFGASMGVEVLKTELYLFLVGLLLVTSIASGAYPALYISKFQVVSILKGKLLFGRRNILSKVFMSLQFVIASIAVVCGIFFTLNSRHQLEREWGYNEKGTFVVKASEAEQLSRLEQKITQLPNVTAISKGQNHIGKSVRSTVIEFPDRKLEVKRLEVAPNYVNTIGLKLTEGRDFKVNFNADLNKVIINQEFVKTLEWEDPLNKTFRYDSVQYTVIGVVEDFHYYNFWNEIEPAFIKISNEEEFKYLVVKTNPDHIISTFEEVESAWASLFPDLPYDAAYQKDLFSSYFQSVNGQTVLMTSVAIIALMMTCLGLFGLVGLNVSGRVKEFSVRKVLGANPIAIAKAISSHFAIFMGVALIVGGPLSYVVVKAFMDAVFREHIPLTAGPIIVGIVMIMITVLITISSHLIKVIRANPVTGLRVE